MTVNLIHVLSDMKSLIEYWNGNGFITEEEMVAQLKRLNEQLKKALDDEPLPGFDSR